MALTQINVSAEKQNIVTGVLLLISVIVPNLGEVSARLRSRMRRAQPAPIDSTAPSDAAPPPPNPRRKATS
jgi:hypothetical protein